MKFATCANATPDGALLILSRDLERAMPCAAIATTLQSALDNWNTAEAALLRLYDALNADTLAEARPVAEFDLLAPLPRAWQWLDGSTYPSHGALMQKAFDLPPIETDAPLMYQGMSHQFVGPHEDVPFPSERDGIDFEGEFAVITDAVPMGCTAAQARQHIKVLVQLNDWSLRAIAPAEMKTGFGWIQAKPTCSFAPFAITPDEFGTAWDGGRLQAIMNVRLNGERFGQVPTTEAAFGFDDLIAHAARTRSLCAGTIIGGGTVSSSQHEETGSSCISERRAIEIIEKQEPGSAFLRFGDRVAMDATVDGMMPAPFGMTDQKVVQA